MSSVGFIILSGLASVVFIISAYLAFQTYRSSNYLNIWIAPGAACSGLALLMAVKVYLFIISPSTESSEWVISSLALVSALLSWIAILSLGKYSLDEAQAKNSAQEEAERFRLSFEKAPQIIVIKDRQGAYIYTNPAFNQFLGKKDLNLAGESDAKFFPRAQANAFHLEEEKAIETSQPRTRDEEIHGIDGIRWLRMSRVPLLDNHNGVKGMLISAQDVTDQKLAAETVHDLEQDLKALFEAEIALSEPVDSTNLWESILDWAAKITGTAHGGVWQIFPERSAAVLKAGCGKLNGIEGTQLKAGEDIVWKVWKSGQVELVNDYQGWPERGQWSHNSSFSSASGLPIKTKSHVLYVLTFFHDKPGQAFRRDQVQLLSVFAQLASFRMQNVESFASSQVEIEDWKRRLETVQYRARLEHMLAVLATHFVTIDPEKIDEGISRSLQSIARVTGLERCYLFLNTGTNSIFPKSPSRYTSWKNTPEELKDRPGGDEFLGYLSKLNQLETIHFPHVKDLTVDKEESAAYLQSRGIKSFTAIPMVSNRSMIGYFALEATRQELEWPAEILAILKTSAEMFVNLIERKWSAKREKEEHEQTDMQIATLERSEHESTLITEMGDLLQACRTSDEAYPIIIRFIQSLIPLGSGALYMIHNTKDPAEKVASWGSEQPGPGEHELVLNECWALRRGRIYMVQDPASESVCGHIKEPLHNGYMCLPLIAQGVAVGVLHLRLPAGQGEPVKFTESDLALATKIGEYIAAPLSNIKLRDELRSQAICDPLTKLYNRRYMEETLEREIRRADRHSTSVGIIMFDIDKMKPINDRCGHDAGDLVLKTLGRELLNMFRGEDVACRYGGDEFTIVLPEASLADVWRRAEQMRENVKRLDLRYDGKLLGPLTLSIGVAAYPDHGQTAERVLLACDAASYVSKSEGGDRIMMGHKEE